MVLFDMPFYDSPGFSPPEKFVDSKGVEFLRATRNPCPVCGHPTGDCAGESGPPGVVFGYNTNSTLDDKTTFYLEEDYYEERELVAGLKTKVLIHRKGKHIPFSLAKELGLV